MADVVDASTRSRMMSGIRGKDTQPELFIRRKLHKLGFRYRIHNNKLPGNPDIVLRKYNAVIFVHGCFWHQHNCHLFKMPTTRREFWEEKISGNCQRDINNIKALISQGWRVMTIWECSIKGKTRLQPNELLSKLINWIQEGAKESNIAGKE